MNTPFLDTARRVIRCEAEALTLLADSLDDRFRAACVRLVQPVDQRAFVVGLSEVDSEAVLASLGDTRRLDLGERGSAVNLRLARAEQVEVRAVEDEEGGGHRVVLARAASG